MPDGLLVYCVYSDGPQWRVRVEKVLKNCELKQSINTRNKKLCYELCNMEKWPFDELRLNSAKKMCRHERDIQRVDKPLSLH